MYTKSEIVRVILDGGQCVCCRKMTDVVRISPDILPEPL